MSTTNSSTSAQPGERSVQAERVFRELIQKESAICSRCFRRKFIAVPVLTDRDGRDDGNREIDSGYVGLADSDGGPQEAYLRFESTAEVEVCFPPEGGADDMAAADRRACPRARTVCDCGAVDADADRATLSKEQALEHAARISERLAEADVDHQTGVLLAEVEAGKSDPDRAGRDEQVFADAVAAALSNGTVTHRTTETELDALVN